MASTTTTQPAVDERGTPRYSLLDNERLTARRERQQLIAELAKAKAELAKAKEELVKLRAAIQELEESGKK